VTERRNFGKMGWASNDEFSGAASHKWRHQLLRRCTMPDTATRIRGISLVMVPTTDQDRAIAFYEALGFEKRADMTFGDGEYHWVEVYPPEGTTGIALAPPPGGEVTPTQTGITLTTDDIDATHAELQAHGVDVDAAVSRVGDPVPPMFWFRDPTGHTLLVVQQP
jgi:catechol 2,3-dioxygenase-like lactoylglutathione lyase family enzyme